MKIRETPDHSELVLYAPSIVLVFETERRDPVCILPPDTALVARIMDGLDARWHDLIHAAVEDIA